MLDSNNLNSPIPIVSLTHAFDMLRAVPNTPIIDNLAYEITIRYIEVEIEQLKKFAFKELKKDYDQLVKDLNDAEANNVLVRSKYKDVQLEVEKLERQIEQLRATLTEWK